ncbi:telomere repeat-binding factor 4 isoform X2 [Capsicum annuum]|uniref:telomere repeat-binding factor 4 isoform X2 n=1 Tax=Capsicum annuum TaxID=4072 RepID=UPI0007BEED38|nr:telomere repeat-binding factor 4 isoform X2 [Capsicum annuum]
MGNPKQKWTSEEEEALRAGVAKHGAGKWKNIQRDPEFNHLLYSRSNIDLKDKWRNLNVSANGQGPRDKSRTPKVKTNLDAAAAPLPIMQAPVSSTLVPQDASADTVMEDSSKCALDGKNASKYNQMIYDALSSLKEPNGSDTSTLVNFIEIENCYKIKKEVLEKTKIATPKQKHVGPRQFPNSVYLGDTAEEAAITAAYKIAEAENKSFVAAEAAKEAERVSKMEEESDNSLQVYKDIFDKCSHGDIVLLMA